MRQILRMMLSGFGVRTVYEAEDGAAALEIAQSRDPDLILLDWLMPILDGAELTRMLRRGQSPGCFVPIIAITSHTEKRRVLAARDSGVTEILCKPVSPRGLYLRIANCVLHPRDFVRTRAFIGPDRRRFQHPAFLGPERRGQGEEDGYVLDGGGDIPHSQGVDREPESTFH